MNGARELAELRARVDVLGDEVTVLGSVLEDLRSGDLTLPGTQGPPAPPDPEPPAPEPPAPEPPAPEPPAPEPPAPEPLGSDGAAEDEPVGPYFDSLLEFVVEHFGPVYARNTSPTIRWCASWWDHAEAIYRLEALWRTWELYRLEPRLGIASWLRDYLDPQLRELISPTGPFASCTEDRHSPVKALPTNQPPEAYLADL